MPELAQLARDLLPEMWDPKSRLFSHKTWIGADGRYVNHGANPLYSAVALIGFLEDAAAGGPAVPRLLGATLDELHAQQAAGGGLALAGCLLWANTLAGDSRARDVLVRATSLVDARRASNLDLGLLLAGLVRCHEHEPRLRDLLHGPIALTRDELLRRFSPSAQLFRSAGPDRFVRGWEGRLTSFASQVYAVHALAELARCVEGSVRAECAIVARRLADRQGPLGQWWWQYSRSSGRTIEGYPVYSVHQDGMAFMALGTLHNLGEAAYDVALWHGLGWLLGGNELGESLVSRHPNLIFRCIQRRGSDPDGISGMSRRGRARAIAASVGLLPTRGGRARRGSLEILRECRSYHLGWLLYARSIAGAW
jgi:hypothetical protein